jgi:DtxR family Mn-dependent transcriptional regulator
MFTLAEENYLKAIYHLEFEFQGGVSTNSIAERLDAKASSVTDMVQKLAEKNVVSYTKYKGTHLTPEGRIIAAKVVRKHRLWEVFLVDKLEFQWDEVHEIAEQLEHIKSDELIVRLDKYLGSPKFDPHGDPIPDKHGNIKRTKNRLLADIEKNQQGICVGVKESSAEYLRYLDKKKISIGSEITVVSKEYFDGSMIIAVGLEQFFISKKIAENLYVQAN